MSFLELVFNHQSYPVPKRPLIDLLEHRGLFTATSYAVQSSVPVDVFETFVDSLKTQKNVLVTPDNVRPLGMLAKEFFLTELAGDCVTYSVDHLVGLSDRVSALERQLSVVGRLNRFQEQIETHEEQLEVLAGRLEKLMSSFRDVEAKLSRMDAFLEEVNLGI
jgi:hypothetical protein